MTLLVQRTPRRRAMAPAAPALVAVSHGTSSAAGQAAVAALVAAVAAARPQLAVSAGFVDVQQPDAPSALESLGGRPAVVVPLLLSAGFHVHVDLRRQLRGADELARALGPDDRLVRVLRHRLDDIGLRRGDRIVLACAGSSDARAVADCHDTGARLASALGRPVRVGFISAARPRLSDAVRSERASARGARVVVANYLLAPGHFNDLVHSTDADLVTPPLLVAGREPAEALVGLVLDRYQQAVTARSLS
ncbi:MAG TPA: CbiX/SirB N-terminal domain-containing protein [Lacisediminihabitans sp.]|nr:CbiX/SirB N-terminal domain-containing protein [Lacisediminihabitans sp.]HXD62514.1 CbiX/SirB N-terminal domain-containing protein [Lacisediminihabitans sp.]